MVLFLKSEVHLSFYERKRKPPLWPLPSRRRHLTMYDLANRWKDSDKNHLIGSTPNSISSSVVLDTRAKSAETLCQNSLWDSEGRSERGKSKAVVDTVVLHPNPLFMADHSVHIKSFSRNLPQRKKPSTMPCYSPVVRGKEKPMSSGLLIGMSGAQGGTTLKSHPSSPQDADTFTQLLPSSTPPSAHPPLL